MSSLWRTERPRFPLYTPDGRGRDYYIKYDNGGYWAEQFQLKKVPDYERTRYSNFHTLFHQAAPFKYWGNGHGRETYILQTNGLFHEQKPLCAYKLTDFLRNNKAKSFVNNYKKKIYMSVSEKKYNNELRRIEKQLIKRLYTEPMYIKTSIHKSRNVNGGLDEQMGRTFTAVNFKTNDKEVNNSQEEFKTCDESDNKTKTIINWQNKEKKMDNIKMNNSNTNKFSKTCENFRKNKSEKKGLRIKTDDDEFYFNVTKRKFKKFFDYNKICSTINYIRPKNDLRYIDPRSKYNRTMKVTFNFKPKPKSDKIKIKKIKAL